MSRRRSPNAGAPPALVQIPHMRDSDLAAVEMILRGEGLLVAVHSGGNECADALYVRRRDLAKVRELLADFRTRSAAGALVPIPW